MVKPGEVITVVVPLLTVVVVAGSQYSPYWLYSVYSQYWV